MTGELVGHELKEWIGLGQQKKKERVRVMYR
jgi:hypothetical protein